MNPKTMEPEIATGITKALASRQPERRPDFRTSAPGKRGMEFPPLDVPAIDPLRRHSGVSLTRESIEGFPKSSEIEVIRHFTRLSTWNYAIDLGMYPLGSCTMKYNPRVNEFVARLDGLAREHPCSPSKFRRAACASSGICRSAFSQSPVWMPPRSSLPRARRAK